MVHKDNETILTGQVWSSQGGTSGQSPAAVVNRSRPGICHTYFENNGLVGGPCQSYVMGTIIIANESNVIRLIHWHTGLKMKLKVRDGEL